jgi:hypothetical protein
MLLDFDDIRWKETYMKTKTILTIAAATCALAILGAAISAHDKYDVKVPGGLAFSEFRGYEDWQAAPGWRRLRTAPDSNRAPLSPRRCPTNC